MEMANTPARLAPRASPPRYMLFWLFACCRTLGRLAFRSSRTRSFFSHALMAARKRDDVQSYTDASHFTEEMSCQLYQRLEMKVNVLVTMCCCCCCCRRRRRRCRRRY